MESKAMDNDINAINDKFIDNMRSMINSLLQPVNKISKINKKNSTN